MPRKARDERLDTRTARLKLSPRREPYWRAMQQGRLLGYRRVGGGKAGRWIAQHYDASTGRQYRSLASADDLLDADGNGTLTFTQAQQKAAEWFKEVERAGGHVTPPLSVDEAMEHYLANYLARGGKDERGLRNTIKVHIAPALGDRLVAALTSKTLTDWHHGLAAAPAKLRTAPNAKRPNVRKPQDADDRRARRSTANRVLTALKAALNLAYRDGRVSSDDAWRRVKPFTRVEAPRIRYLTDDEATRLINACEPDLRALVAAALLTACRYGELARLKVRDLDAAAGILHIREAKGGKPRTVPLSDEGVRFFTGVAVGKAGNSLLLDRRGEAWGDSHQRRRLVEACAAARIAPAISFHVLRHTVASRLLRRGVPMAVIAALLGNTEAICARHYAHLDQGHVNETIRNAVGEFGFVNGGRNVTPLRAIR